MTQLAEYNDGVCFMLLHIHDFHRYLRTVPLHSKTGKEVAQALKSIFTLRADKGEEWRETAERRINFFFSYSK